MSTKIYSNLFIGADEICHVTRSVTSTDGLSVDSSDDNIILLRLSESHSKSLIFRAVGSRDTRPGGHVTLWSGLERRTAKKIRFVL